MNTRLKIKLLLATLSIVPIFSLSNPSYVVAKSPEEVELEKIYLFHEGERLDEVAEDILETDQKATVDLIDEISTIMVKASTTTNEEAIEKLLQEKYSNVIEESGAVHSISTGDVQPTILNDFPSSELIDFNSIKKDNSNMFSIQAIEDAEEDESLYKSWLWDIDLVTNNGASYEIESGNHDVKVGIIDSGIDFNHPVLVLALIGFVVMFTYPAFFETGYLTVILLIILLAFLFRIVQLIRLRQFGLLFGVILLGTIFLSITLFQRIA